MTTRHLRLIHSPVAVTATPVAGPERRAQIIDLTKYHNLNVTITPQPTAEGPLPFAPSP